MTITGAESFITVPISSPDVAGAGQVAVERLCDSGRGRYGAPSLRHSTQVALPMLNADQAGGAPNHPLVDDPVGSFFPDGR